MQGRAYLWVEWIETMSRKHNILGYIKRSEGAPARGSVAAPRPLPRQPQECYSHPWDRGHQPGTRALQRAPYLCARPP